MPTAVAWRTAVALGDDCDARAYCVDKLLKLAAKEQVEIGTKTLIVVDEAGMLSTRQAHHILQLSERHGAKVVFAGDTRQQQPVEAGPGLRLIRDVAGSVRVDRIRRQKADLEGRADPCPQGDAGAGTIPGGADQFPGARRHPRGLRVDGEEAPIHAMAGGGVGGAQGRRDGEGHRGVACAQPASSLLRRGEDHR